MRGTCFTAQGDKELLLFWPRWQEANVFGPAATALGAKTLFSKVQSKPRRRRFTYNTMEHLYIAYMIYRKYPLRAQSVSADFGCAGYTVTPVTPLRSLHRLHRFQQHISVTSAPRGRARDQRLSVTRTYMSLSLSHLEYISYYY